MRVILLGGELWLSSPTFGAIQQTLAPYGFGVVKKSCWSFVPSASTTRR